MRDVVSLAAVGLLVCASCSGGSSTTPTTGTVPPYSAAPLPSDTPIPTSSTVTSSTTMQTSAVPSVAPPPTSTPLSTVPGVSIAGQVTNAEQQAIVDTAVRSWTVYRQGILNPSDPALDAELQSVYVDGALDGTRGFFSQMSSDGKYAVPDPDNPATFSPIVGSLVVGDGQASMLSCQVYSGLLYKRGQDGTPVLAGNKTTIHRSLMDFRWIDGAWFVSRLTTDGTDVEGASCDGHLQF